MFNTFSTTEYIGFLAATITAIALIPQAFEIWRSGSYSCISVFVYSLFTAGAAVWLLYAALIGAWPLIISNTMTLVLAGGILALKLRASMGS